MKTYSTDKKITWCPGCGNFGLLNSLKGALKDLEIETHEFVLVTGIGCSGNMNNWIKGYVFHALHGRTLPVAYGVRRALPKIPIIVTAGDGDAYGEGGNHFTHACRRNDDVVFMVHNNQRYSLTTGQPTPTTSHPYEFNPIANAIVNGATFVARGYSMRPKQLKDLIKKAIQHKGFAFIDVITPCITLNKLNTYDYFNKRVFEITSKMSKNESVLLAMESTLSSDKIALGIFYEEKKLIEKIKKFPKFNLKKSLKEFM